MLRHATSVLAAVETIKEELTERLQAVGMTQGKLVEGAAAGAAHPF